MIIISLYRTQKETQVGQLQTTITSSNICHQMKKEIQ